MWRCTKILAVGAWSALGLYTLLLPVTVAQCYAKAHAESQPTDHGARRMHLKNKPVLSYLPHALQRDVQTQIYAQSTAAAV